MVQLTVSGRLYQNFRLSKANAALTTGQTVFSSAEEGVGTTVLQKNKRKSEPRGGRSEPSMRFIPVAPGMATHVTFSCMNYRMRRTAAWESKVCHVASPKYKWGWSKTYGSWWRVWPGGEGVKPSGCLISWCRRFLGLNQVLYLSYYLYFLLLSVCTLLKYARSLAER